MKNKKGIVDAGLLICVGLFAIGALIGHPKYVAGEWGANGSKRVDYDRESQWFSAESLRP